MIEVIHIFRLLYSTSTGVRTYLLVVIETVDMWISVENALKFIDGQKVGTMQPLWITLWITPKLSTSLWVVKSYPHVIHTLST